MKQSRCTMVQQIVHSFKKYTKAETTWFISFKVSAIMFKEEKKNKKLNFICNLLTTWACYIYLFFFSSQIVMI